MHNDISLKDLFLTPPRRLFEHLLGVGVKEITPTEFPMTLVRPDLVGRLDDGRPLHAEIQGQPEDRFEWRMLGYRWLYTWTRKESGLVQCVFALRGASSMVNRIDEEGLQYEFRIISFEDIDADVLLDGSTSEAVLSVLCRGGTDPARVREVLRRCAKLPKGQYITMAQHLAVLSRMRPALVETLEEARNKMPITYDVTEIPWYREGKQQGMQEGLQQGIRQGEEQGTQKILQSLRETLLQRLTHRFGSVPDSLRQQIATATGEQLFNWVERLVAADSIDSVFQ